MLVETLGALLAAVFTAPVLTAPVVLAVLTLLVAVLGGDALVGEGLLAVETLRGQGLANVDLLGDEGVAAFAGEGLLDDQLAGADVALAGDGLLGDDRLVGMDAAAGGVEVLLDDQVLGDATLTAAVALGGDDGLVAPDALAAAEAGLGDDDPLGHSAFAVFAVLREFHDGGSDDLLARVLVLVAVVTLVGVLLDGRLDGHVLHEGVALGLDDGVLGDNDSRGVGGAGKAAQGAGAVLRAIVAQGAAVGEGAVVTEERTSEGRGGEEEENCEILHL